MVIADARTSGRLQVDHELSGIRPWKERNAQQRKHGQADQEHNAKSGHHQPRPFQYLLNRTVVAIQQAFKAAIEPAIEPRCPAYRVGSVTTVRGLDEARCNNSGTTVIATTYEANSDSTTASASA